ncbi:spermatogenesis-associated protein 7 [Sceloporus undulatus]|uniref:spermatogenesis-associated protein 7 n=1 Tax=Sceloporus undulatus TaxID=8520 RepID=UPI001C4C244F|nr:spermatogenesis-associated protein 7 [Sceloporus undulatus]
MGVRIEDGDGGGGRNRRRRSPVIEYEAIPRYGPASPFKGHLSTKSNAFCIDSSSRRLSNQYLIRDHMAVHYNKILSAKAAVDCSVPKSRLNSIKFSDQQRREKLRKEVERCEKEMISSRNMSRSSSRESRRPMSASYKKESLEAEGNRALPSCAPSEKRFGGGSLSFPEKQGALSPSTGKPATKSALKASNFSVLSSSTSTPSLQRLHSKCSSSSSSDSVTNKQSQKAHNAESKASSGDLLDKHSQCFTNGQQPFTPRTLRSDAKSFLLQYRYYMPARLKLQDVPKQQVEAETQTDISSFQDGLEGSAKWDAADFQKIVMEVDDKVSEKMKAVSQLSSPRVIPPASVQSPAIRRIQADSRQTKMRHLLEILKIDLGCKKEEKSSRGLDKYSLLENDPGEHLQLPNEVQRENMPATSEGLSKAMDLITSESTACSDNFQELEIQDEIQDEHSSKEVSEPGQVEPDPSSIAVTGGNLDTSCTLPPTCNSTTCDADFEISESLREVDDLKESLAESLPISTDDAPQ